jgi:hypothetical protein
MLITPMQQQSEMPRPRSEVGGFSSRSREILGQLQESVREVLASSAVRAKRPIDVERAFGLDAALAWQIHALATKPGMNLTARFVPKPGAMERFLLAAARTASEDAARSVRASYESFQHAVSELAGDRETFDTILTLDRPQDHAGLRKARRAAYRADAAVWGVTCRCMVQTALYRRRPTGEIDSLTLLGYLDVQQLHSGAMVSLPVSANVGGRDTGPSISGAQGPNELIEHACTQPLPRFERAHAPDGSFRDFLELRGLGKQSESTVFRRSVVRDFPGASTAFPHGCSLGCRVPTELLLLDLLIPSEWGGDHKDVRAWITPTLDRYTTPNSAARYRIPFEGGAQYLGTSFSALHSPAALQYASLARSELERLGWSDTEFDIYRCEVQYPVMHSAVHLCVGGEPKFPGD